MFIMDDYLFNIVMDKVQFESFKTVMMCFANIIDSVQFQIIFTEECRKIYIKQISKNNDTIIEFSSHSKNFQELYCSKEKIIICLGMTNLLKNIKCIKNSDKININMMKKDDSKIYIIGKYHDGKKIKCTVNVLEKLPDLVDIVEKKNFYNINMDINDFDDICKRIINISDILNISIKKNKLFFTGNDDESTVDIVLPLEKKSEYEMRGSYNMKMIILFFKCKKICSYIKLSLSNDYPLVITYKLNNFGYMKIYFTIISSD